MPERFKFTKAAIADLPIPPAGKRAEYQDTEQPGLRLRLTSRYEKPPTDAPPGTERKLVKGTVSFCVRRALPGGKTKRYTIGRYPEWTIDQARDEAMERLSEIGKGVDVVAERRDERHADDDGDEAEVVALRLRDCFEDYIASRDLKPRTVRDYREAMRAGFEDWLDKPLAKITKDMVARRHAKRGDASKARANNEARVLRAVFNFAMARYDDENGDPVVTHNPVAMLSKTRTWHRVSRKSTWIRPDQLSGWFESVLALENSDGRALSGTARDFLLLLILTGLRKGEAERLRWSDVDFERLTLTAADTKNREPHELPLSDFLAEMLERRHQARAEGDTWVFPGKRRSDHLVNPYKQIAAVTKASGVEFTLHDLRRTFATVAESLDIPHYAVKRLLNHKLGSDVTAGYLQVTTERLRKPMQRITDFMLRAGGVRPTGDVVPLTPTDRAEAGKDR